MNVSNAQSATFRAGAAFDTAFGFAMLFTPLMAAKILHLELPADRTYFNLAGLLLLILAGMYFVAASSPSLHRLALVAGLGRLAGMLLLFKAAAGGAGGAFWLAGALDGILGATHVTLAMLHFRSAGDGSVGDGPSDRT